MNRALLVGINAYGGENNLAGCINDVTDMANYLVDKRGFAEGEIRLLTDERATTDAIWDRLKWLVKGIKKEDRIVFHYSGHGAQVPTRDKKGRVDQNYEVICPVDFDWTEEHCITDVDFMKFFKTLPRGVEFTWISDSCHSGGLVNEKNFGNPHPANKPRRMIPPADISWRQITSAKAEVSAITFKGLSEQLSLGLIAACKADQTAADASFDNRPNGALTYFLLKNITNGIGDHPLQNVVNKVTEDLRLNGYEQIPLLEGNDTIKVRPFVK